MDNSRAGRGNRETRSPSPPSVNRRYIPPIPPSRSSRRNRGSDVFGDEYRSGDIVLHLRPPPSYEESQNDRILESSPFPTPPPPPPLPLGAPQPRPLPPIRRLADLSEDSREALIRRQLDRFFPESSSAESTPPLVTPPLSPPSPRANDTSSRLNHLIGRLESLSLEAEEVESDDDSDRATPRSETNQPNISAPLPFGVGLASIRAERAQFHKERISRFLFAAILSVKEQAPEATSQQLWLAFVEKVKEQINYEDEDEIRAAWRFVFNESPDDHFGTIVNGTLPEVYWKVYSYRLPA